MKRTTLTLTAIAIAAGIVAAAPATAAPECTEDMVCWDWQTMGNHCRGTDTGMFECARVDAYGDIYVDTYTDIEPDTGAYVGGYN